VRVPKLRGATAVVTGASSGVGWATALRFAGKGTNVVLVARREEPLQRLAAACRSEGVQALVAPADVTDDGALGGVARRAMSRFGRLDVWVNNAAVTVFGRLEEIPIEDIRRVLDVNIEGYIHGSRAAIPWFREQAAGVLINVGSVLSKVGSPYLAPYVISKFASRALSACIRQEVLDVPGISVATVMPGPVDTPLFRHAANHTGREVSVLRPMASPERVGRTIVSVARRPRREVVVGAAPKLQLVGAALAPGASERLAARMVDRKHFSDRAAPFSHGNLHEPMPEGVGPDDGWRDGERRGSGLVALAATAAGAAAVVAATRRGRR
jgi:short-subunit dehydrogenase